MGKMVVEVLPDLVAPVDPGIVPPVGHHHQHVAGDGTDDQGGVEERVAAIVLQHKRASISLVQRHLRIGYNRAARLLEQMEKSGLVSAMGTNGNRDIIVPARSE